MLAESIVFYKPININEFSREEILLDYDIKNELETKFLKTTFSGVELNLKITKYRSENKILIVINPEDLEILSKLFLTTGIVDVICPKLARVDLLDNGGLILSYQYFPDDLNYSELIENSIKELFRVSLFLLEMNTPDIEKWKDEVTNYIEKFFIFSETEIDNNSTRQNYL